jgi:hypothetical protein
LAFHRPGLVFGQMVGLFDHLGRMPVADLALGQRGLGGR